MPVDQQYYREVASGSTAEKLLIAARDRIFRDFIAQMQPSASDEILDVGVSDVINDGANVLVKKLSTSAQDHGLRARRRSRVQGGFSALPLRADRTEYTAAV
ncbi:hypothetical protein ACVWWK_007930 [Bradyrhizobium sp. LB9.1b]